MTAATEQKPRNLTPQELAGVVRAFREMRSWSQEQLAEISGLSARTVQRVEEGVPSSVDTRRALAVAFEFEDVDAINKPYAIPTPEEAAAAKERFEKEHVTLKVESIRSGKQLAGLAQGCHASLFSEGVELSGEAEELFAGLSVKAAERLRQTAPWYSRSTTRGWWRGRRSPARLRKLGFTCGRWQWSKPKTTVTTASETCTQCCTTSSGCRRHSPARLFPGMGRRSRAPASQYLRSPR